MLFTPMSPGWIEVICGCMFCGKTEEMIRRLMRAQYAQQRVQVFKPVIDHRYETEKITAHSGANFAATEVETIEEICTGLQDGTCVVAIDEVQFFDAEIVTVCLELARMRIRVIVAGLDMDFRGEPFGPMPDLLARAEVVTKLHAICTECGNPATRTQRITDGTPAHYDSPLILIGGRDDYQARCAHCHEVPRGPINEA